jgi:hypothetical protein
MIYWYRNMRHEENKMRIVFYRTVLVYLLVGLVASAAVPAVAQTTSNQGIPKTGTTIQHKVEVKN